MLYHFSSKNNLFNYGVSGNHRVDGFEVKTPLMIMKGSKKQKSLMMKWCQMF